MSQAKLVTGLMLGLSVTSSQAFAQAAAKTGFELGARAGYGIPLGKASDAPEGNLSNRIAGMIPLQLDLGYRVIPELMVGAYVQYGFGFLGSVLGDGCDGARAQGANMSCSTHDVRLGVQLQAHFLPGEKVDPWLGAGFGYEWLTISASGALYDRTVGPLASVHGWEFFHLQGGVDFSPTEGLGVGPFAAFTLGQYDTVALENSLENQSADIPDKALHEWLLLGIRATFVL